jgi:hypothetical protein
MAVLKTKDNSEMVVVCKCGCDEGVRIKIDTEFGDYAYMTYLSGNFYKEQNGFLEKIKKIWSIIRNKDFYYSDIIMSKEDFEEYKKWINEH